MSFNEAEFVMSLASKLFNHCARWMTQTLAVGALAIGLSVSATSAHANAWENITAQQNGAGIQSLTAPQKEGPHVTIRLISEKTALTPQAVNRLAVVFDHEPGWHTYWINPGDAGKPPTFKFSVNKKNFTFSKPEFPTPERHFTGGLTSYSYTGQTIFPFTVDIPRFGGTSGKVHIRVNVDYLVCKDLCVPESGTATITVPLSVSGLPGPDAPLMANALKLIPEQVPASNDLTAVFDGKTLRIDQAPGPVVKQWLEFYPLKPNQIDYSANPIFEHPSTAKDVPTDSNSLYLLTKPDFQKNPPKEIEGLLIADGGPANGGWSIQTSIPITPTTTTLQSPKPLDEQTHDATIVAPTFDEVPQAPPSLSLWTAWSLAFIGGLILNLMPCVFPVLSLKLLDLVEGAKSRLGLAIHGVSFTIGVLITMVVLAGVLMLMRAIGESVGWGFQLQSPPVVAFLVMLFTAIVLNLLGVFEVSLGGTRLQAKFSTQSAYLPYVKSLFTGILCVIVASPCTAPYMGAAIGYALTEPLFEALGTFIMLGLGMAMPWLLLCLIPGWTRLLPKPGRWMVILRKIFAIPMACAIAWLLWVLHLQIDFYGFLLVLVTMGITALLCWLIGRQQWGVSRNPRMISLMAILMVVGIGLTSAPTFTRPGMLTISNQWQAWSESAVKQAIAANHPVFVDFTAAWCVTCQANKLAVLNRSEIESAFEKRHFIKLEADWTNRNDNITRVLNQFGRSGVPLYVIYWPNGQVDVLPELLTTQIVLQALQKYDNPPATTP